MTTTFEAVYRAYADRVYRFCLTRVRDHAEAEDVTAEVFVSAFAAFDRTRPEPETTHRWLLRIARNELIDRARKRRNHSAMLSRFFSVRSEADPNTDIEAQVVRNEELRRTLAAAQRLTSRDRVLLGLRFGAELPFAEIGAELGLSEHTAGVAAGRARDRLRAQLVEPAASPLLRAA